MPKQTVQVKRHQMRVMVFSERVGRTAWVGRSGCRGMGGGGGVEAMSDIAREL